MAKAETLQQKMEAQGYRSVKQVAGLVGCSVYTVYRWLKHGQLEGEQVLGHWFVSMDSLIIKVGANTAQMLGLTKEQPDAVENTQPDSAS